MSSANACWRTWHPPLEEYAAFGVFGTALQDNMGIFHSSSLKMVPKTPYASYERAEPLERLLDGVVPGCRPVDVELRSRTSPRHGGGR
jgi:hypothetical protein